MWAIREIQHLAVALDPYTGVPLTHRPSSHLPALCEPKGSDVLNRCSEKKSMLASKVDPVSPAKTARRRPVTVP